MSGVHGPITVGSHGAVTLASSSADAVVYSGPQMVEAVGLTKWTFHLQGTFTNFSCFIYGTNDPAVKVAATLLRNASYNAPSVSPNGWFLLPGPSDQAGTGTEVNPLTAVNQSLQYSGPLTAVCCVITGSGSTGTVNVMGFASKG